jgi:ribosome maturation protein Sdo1
LQQIDLLPLVEQAKILRQLEQKIENATAQSVAMPNPDKTSQQQWQQAVDWIHDRTPISLDRPSRAIKIGSFAAPALTAKRNNTLARLPYAWDGFLGTLTSDGGIAALSILRLRLDTDFYIEIQSIQKLKQSF